MDRPWKKARKLTSTAPMGFQWLWDRRASAVRERLAVLLDRVVSAVAAGGDAVRVVRVVRAEAEAAHNRAQSTGHRGAGSQDPAPGFCGLVRRRTRGLRIQPATGGLNEHEGSWRVWRSHTLPG